VKHKLLGNIGLAFVLFFIVRNPVGAAATANHLGSGLASGASSIGDFFTALFGGGHP
jgi:uncharacterized membrane protein